MSYGFLYSPDILRETEGFLNTIKDVLSGKNFN